MKKLSVLTFTLILLLLAGCQKQQTASRVSQDTITQIDSLFVEYDQLTSPGYAIGIAKDGKMLYKSGYGAANLDYNIPIETHSAFSLASVSKQFTAACIALLIIDGKITLETDAAEFVPELRKYSDTIKVKHLIYNTSGLTDYIRLKRKGGQSWVTLNYFEIDESIATSLAEEKLQFKPGSRWDYCNVNFMLLTRIVEKVSGRSFSDFAAARLFKPLGMQNTFINDDITTVIPNRVTPYNLRNDLYLNAYAEQGFNFKKEGNYIQHNRNSPHYGGSGVVSTIDDLLKWTANMTTQQFGGQDFYNQMHQTMKFPHGRNNQAFGLYFDQYKGRKTVAWEGADYGISTQLLRFPEQNTAIIVLSNLGSGNTPEKANRLADILIKNGILE